MKDLERRLQALEGRHGVTRRTAFAQIIFCGAATESDMEQALEEYRRKHGEPEIVYFMPYNGREATAV